MIFRKRKTEINESLNYIAWQRFKRNKLSLGGMVFIVLSAMIALFGYIITPDKSAFANNQILEISTRKPGFKVQMLKVRKNEIQQNSGFLSTMFFGRMDTYNYIPINSYHFDRDKILIQEFNDIEGEESFYSEINIADVIYPLKFGEKVKINNSQIEFTLVNNKKESIDLKQAHQLIEKENIITKRFLLGTDRFGRDLLSRLLIGTRVSLSVGFISVFISLLIGITLGSLAGFYRGKVDDLIMWLINVIWSIPTLLMVIAITLVIGKGFWQIFIAVGLTMWVEVARVVRGQVLSIREKEYVEAARALGFSNRRIIFRHILPNVMSPVIIISAANFATAILLEAGLSFLGIGVQPPVPSWGTMIKEHYGYIIMDKAYLAILPGLAIMFLVLSFTLVGNGLRDALDTKGSN
ncbi:MAG: peptide transporter [Bacteroidetes bacterium GWF2_33_16]|nr:MAG: peptide transporter [Bacteroidetes bacterium GWE2_32_14]OFY05277.1 MAG: peptide transporter [Bacteroidetes bacterium GWF2_33_16]